MAENEVEASLGQLALVPLQSPKMTTIDIATTDGDIMLVLGETRLRVSSVILSSASPVFKTMLGPKFLEGQGSRSSQDPKDIVLPEDDVAAMERLCRLLHHQDDMPAAPHDEISLDAGAEELRTLTALADKYDCVRSVRLACAYTLFSSASFLASSYTSMETLLRFIAAAYMLKDSRHFALFTRCMVMDYVDPYSRVAYSPDLTALPKTLLRKSLSGRNDYQSTTTEPVLKMNAVLLEEQRNTAGMSLRFELPAFATQRCYRRGCSNTGTDVTISHVLALKINSNSTSDRREVYWPPQDNQYSLRDLLRKTFHCGEVGIHLATGCNHEHDYEHKVDGESLKRLCRKVSKMACGLCLICLQDDKTDPDTCSHRHLLEQCAENDPFS